MHIAQGIILTGLAALSFLSAPPSPADDLLPIEAYASLPEFEQVRISPDGRKICGLLNRGDTTTLITQELGSAKTYGLLETDNEKFRFRWAAWANDERLLLGILYPDRREGTETSETRLLAINFDGSKKIIVVKPRNLPKGRDEWQSQFQDHVIGFLPGDDDHVLVSVDLDEPIFPSVFKFDIYSGGKTRVRRAKRRVLKWIADEQGDVRVGIGLDDTSFKIEISDAQTKKWRTGWQYEIFDETEIQPLGFGSDPNWLYLRMLNGGRYAIFKVDLHAAILKPQLMAADPDYDIEGTLIRWPKSRDIVGVYYVGDFGRAIYWDEEAKHLQQALDAALPNTSNYIVDMSRDEKRYILFSTSQTQPGKYYLGDRDTNSLTEFGAIYRQLGESNLSGKKKVAYKTRDGLEIEALLTVPKNTSAENLPTIIFPHGGPMSRDTAGFDYWSEFFASRGYAVLQMNFRGSTGYGHEFMASGLKNWGLKMQDDITDGAKWMIDQKIADPNRICIVGASYGGYAALMGTVKTPDLYRCAVSFAGVSDLREMIHHSGHFIGSEIVEKQIGDLREDRDQLSQTSPALHADAIKVPILLVHGAADRVVPIKQSKLMAKALKSSGKAFDFIILANGTHNLEINRNRIQLFSAMEQFLAKHLKPQQSLATD